MPSLDIVLMRPGEEKSLVAVVVLVADVVLDDCRLAGGAKPKEECNIQETINDFIIAVVICFTFGVWRAEVVM